MPGRTGVLLLLTYAAFFAAEVSAPASLRGTLLEVDAPSPEKGQFSLRLPDHRVLVFLFDENTAFHGDSGPITALRIHPGDLLEVAADAGPATVRRYARSVSLIASAAPPARAITRATPRRTTRLFDSLMPPRGSLVFSGLVLQASGTRLKIRTRGQGDHTVILREDTRFVRGGTIADSSELEINTRVFIRGWKNAWDEVEAFQVAWGPILVTPRSAATASSPIQR